jgi:hypothetical protein
VSKEINSVARKLHIRVTRAGDSFFVKGHIVGGEAQALLWLQKNAVRRGVLPATVLPEGDFIRVYTELNGTDPAHKIL